MAYYFKFMCCMYMGKMGLRERKSKTTVQDESMQRLDHQICPLLKVITGIYGKTNCLRNCFVTPLTELDLNFPNHFNESISESFLAENNLCQKVTQQMASENYESSGAVLAKTR